MILREHGTYWTRHGFIVGPIYYDAQFDFFYADNEWAPELKVETWDRNGHADPSGTEQPSDLVREWIPG